MLYVGESLNATRLHKIDFDSYDALYIELINKTTKIIVGIVYKPPKQCEENHIALWKK